MANTTANITATTPKSGGEFFRGPLTATVPTSATTELTGLNGLGYTGEDGFTVSVTRDTEDKKAYGGDTVYTLQTDYGVSVQVSVYESQNAEVLRAVFGDENVTVDGSNTTILYNKKRLGRNVYVTDHETDQGLLRQVIPIGQVTEVGDITLVHSDILSYELTITAYPDADGNYMYEYRTDDEDETP